VVLLNLIVTATTMLVVLNLWENRRPPTAETLPTATNLPSATLPAEAAITPILEDTPMPLPGETLPAPPAPTATPLVQRALTSQDVNLRARPSLNGAVLAGLPEGTWVDVPYPLQTRAAEGWVWVFVHTSFGSGWLVRAFLNFNP